MRSLDDNGPTYWKWYQDERDARDDAFQMGHGEREVLPSNEPMAAVLRTTTPTEITINTDTLERWRFHKHEPPRE